jgi:hypothetical protein
LIHITKNFIGGTKSGTHAYDCLSHIGKKTKKTYVATLTLGSRPRQGLARLQAKRRNLGVMPHVLGNVRKCEGMNLHTPKGASTLGVGVSVDFQNFIEQLQGSKLNGLKSSLYQWKDLKI